MSMCAHDGRQQTTAQHSIPLQISPEKITIGHGPFMTNPSFKFLSISTS
jgi:hypothetical protein